MKELREALDAYDQHPHALTADELEILINDAARSWLALQEALADGSAYERARQRARVWGHKAGIFETNDDEVDAIVDAAVEEKP